MKISERIRKEAEFHHARLPAHGPATPGVPTGKSGPARRGDFEKRFMRTDMAMKVLKSEKMRRLLGRGMRIATRHGRRRRPSDGMLTGLFHETLPNGWHYQVDWIHDTRFMPSPWIEVFAFRPGHKGMATHSLRSDQLLFEARYISR